jgi:hypothetical protein
MWILKRPVDAVLVAILFISIVAVLLGLEDPFFRNELSRWINFPEWLRPQSWLKLSYDLGVGSLVSLFFYWLVVRIPEREKRKRIKRSFANHYREFKEDCIQVMLTVADGSYEYGFHETLVDHKKFRAYFEQKVSSSQDRWDAFHNNLDHDQLQSLLRYMEIFRDEIQFVLVSIDIRNDKPFEFLKRFSNAIALRKGMTLDYDSTKSFGNFLWEIFAGFSLVKGPLEHDIVTAMISEM